MRTPADIAAFAAAAAAAPRAFAGSDTAVGQGLRLALAQFADVPDCARRVVDISGDGQENAGFTDARAHAEAVAAGVTVNAIAIEEAGQASPVTQYYRRWIITPGGFVVTTRGLRGYAETLRLKLLRELLAVTG
jgi:Ca-activated chloride channel family protein